MKAVAFIAALVGTAAAIPQAVTSAVAPNEKTPDGCKTSYSGKFNIVVSPLASASKRSLEKRESTALEVTLQDGVMTDAKGRTGYIASNQQFQFDGPAQAGAIYTSGWSVCSNGSIALGDSAVFYQCLSGTFYNLYDENQAEQCSAVYLDALSTSGTTATVNQVHTIACQITDGQVQQNTCLTTVTAPPAMITQISDGQIQAPTGAIVTQITDGQIQAPTASASKPAVVSQISDGQPQAPTATATPAVQAPTGGATVSQISDGQIQAPTNGTSATFASPTLTAASSAATSAGASASPSGFTGAAAQVKGELFGLAAAAAVAVFAL